MKRYLFAACSALLLSALVTEVHFRLFPEQYFALFLLAALAIFIAAIATSAFAAAPAVLPEASPQGAPARRSAAGAPPAAQRRGRAAVEGGATAPSESEPEPDGERETGSVKWFNRNKGYGFIARDGGGEIFVHYKGIRGSGRRGLREGQRVSFTVVEHEKGLQADKVTGFPTERAEE